MRFDAGDGARRGRPARRRRAAPTRSRVGFTPGDTKRLQADGAPVERLVDVEMRPLVCVFLPDRLELVKGPPALRRSHLDQVVAASWPVRARHAARLRPRAGAAQRAAGRRSAAGAPRAARCPPGTPSSPATGSPCATTARPSWTCSRRASRALAEALGLGTRRRAALPAALAGRRRGRARRRARRARRVRPRARLHRPRPAPRRHRAAARRARAARLRLAGRAAPGPAGAAARRARGARRRARHAAAHAARRRHERARPRPPGDARRPAARRRPERHHDDRPRRTSRAATRRTSRAWPSPAGRSCATRRRRHERRRAPRPIGGAVEALTQRLAPATLLADVQRVWEAGRRPGDRRRGQARLRARGDRHAAVLGGRLDARDRPHGTRARRRDQRRAGRRSGPRGALHGDRSAAPFEATSRRFGGGRDRPRRARRDPPPPPHDLPRFAALL